MSACDVIGDGMLHRLARHSLGVTSGAYWVGGFPVGTSRRTMRAPQFDPISLWSNFTLSFQCEALLARSVAKSAVFGVSRIMMGACCRAPAISVYLDRVRLADASFFSSNCATSSLARPTHLSLHSSSTSPSYSFTSLAFFHPSTSPAMPPADNGKKYIWLR